MKIGLAYKEFTIIETMIEAKENNAHMIDLFW